MKVGIIGSGVSGLVVAHHLHATHDVTVFESDDRIGGHVNTVDVEVPDGRFAVDTGFIVCNEHTYPNFLALLDHLGVATQPSEMSFSVSDQATGIEYRASTLTTLYAQRRNILRPSFHRMVLDILRFNRALRAIVASGRDDPAETLAEFIDRGHYSPAFINRFLIPFGASIWSADPSTFLDFPLTTYARFVSNHGMIDTRRKPCWRTVSGGSATYVEALTAPFRDDIRQATPVHRVVRHPLDGTITVVTNTGSERFDHVVMATHSDDALRLIEDPSPAEHEILGAIGYQTNVATLHCDERFLPSTPQARASWNFHAGEGDGQRAALTYWMNRLQSIPSATPLLVTLNRHDDIDPELVFQRFEYRHPVFDEQAIRAQRRRTEIQGVAGISFAGAYWGYGFHEDGVVSALDVVRLLSERSLDRSLSTSGQRAASQVGEPLDGFVGVA